MQQWLAPPPACQRQRMPPAPCAAAVGASDASMLPAGLTARRAAHPAPEAVHGTAGVHTSRVQDGWFMLVPQIHAPTRITP
jgi:hypothetical protein